MSRLITLRELAEATGIAYNKLRYGVYRGTIPVERDGRRVFVDVDNPVIKLMLNNPSMYAEKHVKTKPRPVMYQNKKYPSVHALARAVKRNIKTVMYWLYSGKAVYLDK